MSKKVAQVIVETLQAAGVRNCYGVVGDTLNLIAPLRVGRGYRLGMAYSVTDLRILMSNAG